MSFAGDGSRRYGHVPPVQYPVPGQSQQPQSYGNARRQSFNSGDDTGFLDNQNTGRGDEELFLTSPTDTPASGRTTFGSTNTAMSGFQHQYQAATPPTPSTYNPQAFARSQSTSLPYHPHPAGRYGSPTSTTATAFPPQATGYTPAAYNPAAYNPAAYASAAVPQRQSTYHGYNNYNQAHGNAPLQTYGQSPNAAYAPTFPQPPPSATSQSSYDQPLQSPGYSSPTYHQTPSYDPSNNYSTAAYGAYSSNGTVAVPSQYSAASPQASYPAQTQMPTGPQYSMINDSNSSFHNRASRSNSQTTPPMISPPVMVQTSPGLQRHPTNAPLPSRPLDDLSEDQAWNPTQAYDGDISQEQNLQDDLFNDIEAELGGTPGRSRPVPVNGQQFSDEEIAGLRRFGSTATASSSHTPSSSVTRYPSVTSTAARTNAPSMWDYDDDDSDPEGVAGVLAMKEAEMEDRRFSGGGSTFSYSEPPTSHQNRSAPLPPPPEEQSSDSDFAGMDIGMFSGGFAGNLTYGNDGPPNPNAHAEGSQLRPLPTPQGSNPPYPTYDNYEEAPAFRAAEMDYGGTGGLQAPSAHRLSFDDGEEQVSIHSRQSGSESPLKEDYYDQFFYHPGLTNRPLPALPPGSDTSSLLSVNTQSRGPYQHNYSLSADSRLPQTAEGPDSYYPAGLAPQNVERSVSLSSHSHTPQIQTPARSRTDAAEERRRIFKQQQQLAAQQGGTPLEGYDTGTPMSMTYDTITLPTGRKRKFVPSKLTAADIKRCTEPWALSGIAAWIREMADGEPDLRQKTIEDGLVKLFTSKVPTMNIADAETLSTRSIEMMLKEGILVPEEEWVKFGQGQISGVLWQLTGSGCYAPKLHEYEAPGRCYSHHCGRTLRKANVDDLLLEDAVSQEDWATFYKLTKELVEASGKNKKEIERQNILHEIVTSEELYMTQLDVLKVLYRENLRTHNPPIIAPKSLDKFLSVVFGKVEMVQKTNKDNLLAQLKYRQQEQGPWIIGFSDLFREWIRKAKNIYIEYAANFPYATHMVRKESDRNLLFRQFLDQVRGHKRSGRLDWTHFLKAPVTRLQRYSFLLETVEKTMKQDSEEKTNLAKAIAEIKIVTLECDARVAEMQKKVEMMELNSMLVCRPGLNLNLNLDHLGRELIMQGDLQRLSGKGVKWVNTHALLFDHYFILAKVVSPDRGRQEKKFNVSKDPIPMPLLFLESANDEAVNKQKGITAPLSRATATSASDTRLNKIPTNGADRPGLEHTTTGSSIGSLNVTRLTPSISSDDGKILYPFRIKHLGHEVYTLYATTPQARQDWCNKIIEAKTRHAKALFSQNAEPFRLRVLADSAFSYDSATAGSRPAGVSVRGTPLDRAIRDLEKVFGPGRGPAPVCRATVNCATGFTAFGKSVIAIGTDYGVYISDATDPRGWQRTVQIPRVTQIAVLEEFSICLVISDRSLIAYPLDVVAPVSNFPAPAHDNPRRAPQRLAKDVAFFATARMKERMLLFYKRKEGLHNTFKVLEPVFQKSTEKKTRLFGSRKGATGSTESFRDFDEFYLPTECYSLNLFQTYIAVSTAKGIELLTLDKKQTMSIPDLKQPAIANIAQRIRDQRPLGMFKLNDQEFLLTYEDCAVYVDKHGDVSRTLIMEYSGTQKKARGATMYGQYLLLFNEDYVEVRNAENGRLRQIIAGRDVRCLDYGIRGPTPPSFGQAPGPANNWGAGHSNPIELSKGTVKIAMSHPEIPGMQIVLEMLLNDGHTEK